MTRRARGLLLALAILLAACGGSGSGGGTYPTPRPVTFIPPTPRPTQPVTVLAPAETLLDQPVADITLVTLDGERLKLRDLGGTVVFLNFWATWCEPCRQEMPALQKLQEQQGAALRVIGVTDASSGTEQDIRAFLERYGVTFSVALDPEDEVFDHFGAAQLPTTYIIDRSGVTRFRHIGALDAQSIAAYLDILAQEE